MRARLRALVQELDIWIGGLFFLIGAPLVIGLLLLWFLGLT